MEQPKSFPAPNPYFKPPLGQGLILQGAALLVLSGGAAAAVWFALQFAVGVNFILLLLLALALFLPLPLLIYRFYALLTARYTVEREGLRLRWGLRAEDIPLSEIEWVRMASDLPFDLPRPRLTWPGAMLGTRRVRELGIVEYLAAGSNNLTLIASPNRVYAISPVDAKGFIAAVQNANELGSLLPFTPLSTQPAMFLRRVWQDAAARWLILTGLLLDLALFVLVSLVIPTRTQISFGFDPSGAPLPPGPPQMLMLFPILAGSTFILDLFVGLFFYRSEEQRPAAHMLFASMLLPPLLLIIALAFIR
ncbi:MAG: PH domain-containing protein [Anaerolineaceae bacterium]